MLNIHLTYDIPIQLLSNYLRKIKAYVHANSFTQMFIVFLFVEQRQTGNTPNILQQVKG